MTRSFSDRDEAAAAAGLYAPATYYDDVPGFYSLGLSGTELRRTIERRWRELFLFPDDHVEVDSPVIMPEGMAEASGFLDGWTDPIVPCKACETDIRADHVVENALGMEDAEGLSEAELADLIEAHDIRCPDCGGTLQATAVTGVSLLLSTAIGSERYDGYLRPETAESSFVHFPAVRSTQAFPVGIGQIGKAFRNEIGSRQSMTRLREFTLAELQTFVRPGEDPPLDRVADESVPLMPAPGRDDAERRRVHRLREAVDCGTVRSPWEAYYIGVMTRWFRRIGIDFDRMRFREVPRDELWDTAIALWDGEVEIAGEWVEVAGIYHSTGQNVAHHQAGFSDEAFLVETASGEAYPETVEPSCGLERILYAAACHAYDERDDVFVFPPAVAPTLVEVDPESSGSREWEAIRRAVHARNRRVGIADGCEGVRAPFEVRDGDTAADSVVLIDRRDDEAERLAVSDAIDRLTGYGGDGNAQGPW